MKSKNAKDRRKSKVNEAGNSTKPSMRKRLKKENAEKQRTKDLNKDIKNALKSQNDLFS